MKTEFNPTHEITITHHNGTRMHIPAVRQSKDLFTSYAGDRYELNVWDLTLKRNGEQVDCRHFRVNFVAFF